MNMINRKFGISWPFAGPENHFEFNILTSFRQFLLNEIVYAQLSVALLLETAIRILRRRSPVRGPASSASDDAR